MRIFLAGAGAAAGVGCHPKSNCDLSLQLAQRAGPGAKDCGSGPSEAGIADRDACVVSRFEKGEAFVAQYVRESTEVVFGISSNGKGNVAFLTLDSDPDPVINAEICNGPTVDTSSDRDPATTPPLTCASTTNLGPTCGAAASHR